MKQKIQTTDEIILQAIKEKHSFESHKDDISYASHHKKVWIRLDRIDLDDGKKNYDSKTLTLSELKKVVDEQLKVK